MWNDCRRQLVDDLYGIEKVLGSTYQRAVELIDAYSPDCDSAYIDAALIGHCVRELINSLPRYMSESQLPTSAKGKEDRARDSLMAEIDECSLHEKLKLAEGAEVPVPQSLIEACLRFKQIHEIGSINAKTKDSMTVFGSARVGDPSLNPWSEARRFFMRFTHLDGKFESELPTRDEMDKQLACIDRSLMTRFGHFFEAKRQLMLIVDEANKTTEDGRYPKPSEDVVLGALSLINNDHLRHAFYLNLKNPEWLTPLDKQKVFESALQADDGVERGGPESVYLVAMARSRQEKVIEILLRAASEPGFYGRQAIVSVANQVSAPEAKKLASEIIKWLESPDAITKSWDIDTLLSVAAKLLDCKETHKVGKKLTYALFMPRASDKHDLFSPVRDIVPGCEYGSALEALRSHLSLDERKEFATRMLEERLKITNKDLVSETSSILMPSVGAAVASGGESIVGCLAGMLVSALREFADEDADVIENATSSDKSTLKRCAIYVLTEQIRDSGGDDNRFYRIAMSVLDSADIYNYDYDAETVPFLAASLQCNNDGLVSKAFQVISNPDDCLLADYREKKRARFEDEGHVEDEARRCVRRWQHRRLSLVRGNDNPSGLSDLLKARDAEFGEREYSFEMFTTRTISGPNSPISLEQMCMMLPDELMAYLAEWRPSSEETWNLIEPDGLARVLSKAVSNEPTLVAGKTNDLKKLNPVYCEHVIDGLADAILNGDNVAINDFVELCTWASGLDETATPEVPAGSSDDVAQYRNLIFSSINNVVRLLEMDDASIVFSGFEEGLLEVLMNGMSSDEPDAVYEEEYSTGDQGPIYLASNTIRPRSVEGLARWIYRFPNSAGVRSALDAIQDVSSAITSSEADAAAFGLAIPWLVSSCSKWMIQHRENFFGSGRLNSAQQIALAVALAYFNYSRFLFEYLSPVFENALRHDCFDCSVGYQAIARNLELRIGDWIFADVALGFSRFDDPLVELWCSKVELSSVWDVMDYLCAMLSRTDDDKSDFAESLGHLWDCCFERCGVGAGAKDFAFSSISHLAMSGYYDEKWWSSRMLESVKGSCAACDLHPVVKELLELAKEHPDTAFYILEASVASKRESGLRDYAYKKLAVPLLGNAICIGDVDITKRALSCMDKLGSRGMTNLDSEVTAFVEQVCPNIVDSA